MTLLEYRKAKLAANYKYLADAESDLKVETGKNKITNAKKRIEIAKRNIDHYEHERLNLIDIQAYKTLYKNSNDFSSVSAI